MSVQNESLVKDDILTELSGEIRLADQFNLQAIGFIYPLSRIYSVCLIQSNALTFQVNLRIIALKYHQYSC